MIDFKDIKTCLLRSAFKSNKFEIATRLSDHNQIVNIPAIFPSATSDFTSTNRSFTFKITILMSVSSEYYSS